LKQNISFNTGIAQINWGKKFMKFYGTRYEGAEGEYSSGGDIGSQLSIIRWHLNL